MKTVIATITKNIVRAAGKAIWRKIAAALCLTLVGSFGTGCTTAQYLTTGKLPARAQYRANNYRTNQYQNNYGATQYGNQQSRTARGLETLKALAFATGDTVTSGNLTTNNLAQRANRILQEQNRTSYNQYPNQEYNQEYNRNQTGGYSQRSYQPNYENPYEDRYNQNQNATRDKLGILPGESPSQAKQRLVEEANNAAARARILAANGF